MWSSNASTARSFARRRITSDRRIGNSSRSASVVETQIMSAAISKVRPRPDKVLVDIADYASKFKIVSKEAYATAHYCLLDTLGCGFEALSYPACTKLLGPII